MFEFLKRFGICFHKWKHMNLPMLGSREQITPKKCSRCGRVKA